MGGFARLPFPDGFSDRFQVIARLTRDLFTNSVKFFNVLAPVWWTV